MSEQRHVWADPEHNDFMVAATQREAYELHCAHIGCEPGISCEALEYAGGWPETEWSQLPDDKVMPIANYNDDGVTVTKTCAEWAVQEQPGYLAGTEH